MSDTFTKKFLDESLEIIRKLDAASIEATAVGLGAVRDGGGRLFILGVGGSAGHAGHAVNDFRKICGFESYAPTDNVSELTARVNDEGWDTCFSEWLKGSRLRKGDALLVFSVGGGNREKNVSVNLVPVARACARSGREDLRRRRSRRRVHQAGGRRLRRHSHGRRRPRDAAHRGLRGRRVAPARQPPGAGEDGDQVGERRSDRADGARRDPRSRRHHHRRRARRGDGGHLRRLPPRPAAPALGRGGGDARAAGRGLRARHRDQPACPREGAVLGRRRAPDQRRARGHAREGGHPHRGARGLHAPPRWRGRGRRFARRQVRLPQAEARDAEHAHDAPGRRPRAVVDDRRRLRGPRGRSRGWRAHGSGVRPQPLRALPAPRTGRVA